MSGCGAVERYLRALVAAVWLFHMECLGVSSESGFSKLSEAENTELRRICGKPFFPEFLHSPRPPLSDPDYKVYGGDVVLDGEMPWALKIFNSRGGSCSASLISQRHFITASHCLLKNWVNNSAWHLLEVEPYKSYAAFGGSCCAEAAKDVLRQMFRIGVKMKTCTHSHKKPRLLTVKAVLLPNTSVDFITKHLEKAGVIFGNYFFSDIAVFELEKPIPADDPDMRPVCLLQNELWELPPDLAYLAFGFGQIDKGGLARKGLDVELLSFHLLDVIAISGCKPKQSVAICRAMKLGYVEFSHARGWNKSLCAGDSGGGLTTEIDGRVSLVGVYSCGRGYCDNFTKFSEIFTRMDLHIGFICYYVGICPPNYKVAAEDVDVAIFPVRSVDEKASTTTDPFLLSHDESHLVPVENSGSSSGRLPNAFCLLASLILLAAFRLFVRSSS